MEDTAQVEYTQKTEQDIVKKVDGEIKGLGIEGHSSQPEGEKPLLLELAQSSAEDLRNQIVGGSLTRISSSNPFLERLKQRAARVGLRLKRAA